MFKKTPDTQLEALNDAIDTLFAEMKGFDSFADEYAAMTKQVAGLMKLREELTSGRRISPDALAGLVGSLSGILLILNFERAGAVTSKALGFVSKFR
jgi:hypothetical protein